MLLRTNEDLNLYNFLSRYKLHLALERPSSVPSPLLLDAQIPHIVQPLPCTHAHATHTYTLSYVWRDPFLLALLFTKLLSVVFLLCHSGLCFKDANGLMYFSSSQDTPHFYKSKMSLIARCSITLCAAKKNHLLQKSRDLKLHPAFKDV